MQGVKSPEQAGRLRSQEQPERQWPTLTRCAFNVVFLICSVEPKEEQNGRHRSRSSKEHYA